MGGYDRTTTDPTNPAIRGAAGQGGAFAEGLFQNPFGNFGGLQGMLQSGPQAQQAQAALMRALGNPGGGFDETSALWQSLGPLLGMANSGPMQFQNQFSELQLPAWATAQQGQLGRDPFGGSTLAGLQDPNAQISELQSQFPELGFVNQAERAVSASEPAFFQRLARERAALGQAAPSRFSSAFAQEGTDLTSTALRDFEALRQQAILQGLGLQQQGQAQAQNFALGARGLTQQEREGQRGFALGSRQSEVAERGQLRDFTSQADQTKLGGQNQLLQFLLGARGLQQDATNQTNQANLQGLGLNQQGILGSLGLLGDLSAQASQNPFERALGASQFGLQQNQAALNPIIQLLLGAFGFSQPSPLETTATPNSTSQWLNFAGGLLPGIISSIQNRGSKPDGSKFVGGGSAPGALGPGGPGPLGPPPDYRNPPPYEPPKRP